MEKGKIIPLKKLIIFIILLWILSTVIIKVVFGNWNNSGTFGDTFGAINSLFSGLALAGIIYTIYLQKTELSLQREELKYTREELKRTADAQESSSKLLTEQIRINNIPYLQFSFGQVDMDNILIISNNSDNPAYDIDVRLFISIDNSEYTLENFIVDRVKSNDTPKIKFGENDLLDGMWYYISDRGIYNYFPKGKKIEIPLDYIDPILYFEVFIQFRDVLGNNYYQHIHYAINGDSETPYIDNIIEPIVPMVIDRFNFNEEIKDDDDLFANIMKTNSVSIYANFLDYREYSFLENKWTMT